MVEQNGKKSGASAMPPPGRGQPYVHTPSPTFLNSETGIALFRLPCANQSSERQIAERTESSPDMLLISRGSGTSAFGKMAGSAFSVPATTAVRATFTPRGTDSHIIYNPTAQTFGLTFPDGYLKTLMTDAQQHCAFNPLLFLEDARLLHLAQVIEAEIARPGFASPMMIEGVSRAIAVVLLRLDEQPILAEAERIKLSPWRLRRVLDYIDCHLEDDVRLCNLAAVAGLSTFHFARVFKQETGVTPYNYVRDRRIERSRALLIEDKLGISELALACGFASQSHFTAAFSKAVGTSPGRFRRENRT